jgi:uncharacterized protein (DUF1697 family)
MVRSGKDPNVAKYVALLRGINLGAVNKVPMADLRALFDDLGHSNVRTYVQSGNVVFEATKSTPKKLAVTIEQHVGRAFGHKDISVIVRSRSELERIATGNPFPTKDTNPTLLHVIFLADTPTSKSLSSLDPDRSPPDQFVVRGKDIYLSLPKGSGRSKLTIDYFEKRLGTRGTGRNWNTVTRLLDMMNDRR